MTKHIIFVIGITLGFGIGYEAWQFGKWINYRFAYESGVEKTVKELVKPECLITEKQDAR